MGNKSNLMEKEAISNSVVSIELSTFLELW